MTKEIYCMIENFMCSCMDDAAHDRQHVYRVLYNALEIAAWEPETDYDILITACLLHDIGRVDQLADPSLCHAAVGADKARRFLTGQGFEASFIQAVCHCIQTHRFRKSSPPQTLEARILFDADKLDVTGAIGIARTLEYQGRLGQSLYTLLPDGSICDGSCEPGPSFFYEYKFKLENLYERFYTKRGSQLAESRRKAAQDFYHSLYHEVSSGYTSGQKTLEELLK